jgi:hypothetical protein
MNGWPRADAGSTGRAGWEQRRRRAARCVVLVAALAVQAAVLVAVAVDAPFAVRLPLALAYVGAVPGVAVVGLLRLDEPATEVALSVIVSLLLCTATAQVLVWTGAYSLGTTLVVLGVLSTWGLVAQLRDLRRRLAEAGDVPIVGTADALAGRSGPGSRGP